MARLVGGAVLAGCSTRAVGVRPEPSGAARRPAGRGEGAVLLGYRQLQAQTAVWRPDTPEQRQVLFGGQPRGCNLKPDWLLRCGYRCSWFQRSACTRESSTPSSGAAMSTGPTPSRLGQRRGSLRCVIAKPQSPLIRELLDDRRARRSCVSSKAASAPFSGRRQRSGAT